MRAGDHVTLRWTTPLRTTDDMEIRGTMTAEACREVGARPLTPLARASACVPVRRIAVNPGPSEVIDTLPPALQADPVTLLTYRVRIYNSTGHSAGDSAGVYAAAGSVPHVVESLRATGSERGAVLEWQGDSATRDPAADFVYLTRIDTTPNVAASKENKDKAAAGGPAGGPAGKAKAARMRPVKTSKPETDATGEAHLRAPEKVPGSQTDTEGTVDTTALMGDTYSYRAQRVRQMTTGGHPLEIRSEDSTAVAVALADTFPPRVPTGLGSISGVAKPSELASAGGAVSGSQALPYVDLSWEPNSEADLAGYRIYRQAAGPDGSPQGPLVRLTATPIAAPVYRDVAVRAGQGYIYSVTAVDATGNESAPSAKVLETTARDDGESLK